MRKALISVLIPLLLTPLAISVPVNINVESTMGGFVEYLEMKKQINSTVQKFGVQWYNSKSVSCKTRMEFEIYRGKNYSSPIKSVWTESRVMNPGASVYFETYWIPPSKGNYSVKMSIHQCQSVVERKIGNFSVVKVSQKEKTINIKAENQPGGVIRTKLESNKTIENVVVVPEEEPMGWVFEPTKVGKLNAGEEKSVEVGYKPSVWKKESVTLKAISLNGKHSSKPTKVTVKKEVSFWKRHGEKILVLALLVSILGNISLLYVTKTHYM